VPRPRGPCPVQRGASLARRTLGFDRSGTGSDNPTLDRRFGAASANSYIKRHGSGWRRLRGMSRVLIVIGLVVAATGVLWPWLGRLGLGRLPGDIVIRHGSFTIYAPIATCLLVSILLSLIFWILGR
jgi:hypothetical protein